MGRYGREKHCFPDIQSDCPQTKIKMLTVREVNASLWKKVKTEALDKGVHVGVMLETIICERHAIPHPDSVNQGLSSKESVYPTKLDASISDKPVSQDKKESDR